MKRFLRSILQDIFLGGTGLHFEAISARNEGLISVWWRLRTRFEPSHITRDVTLTSERVAWLAQRVGESGAALAAGRRALGSILIVLPVLNSHLNIFVLCCTISETHGRGPWQGSKSPKLLLAERSRGTRC